MSMEKFKNVFAFAGVGCFALAWVAEGWLPLKHLGKIPMKTMDQVAGTPTPEFVKMSELFPAQFKDGFGPTPNKEAFQKALKMGRDLYIGEACWHCHSQFVRPVSNEETRFGKVSTAAEYQNEMFLPHLFGTRRVGPDLIREAGKHSLDWHVAHFYDPSIVVPTSVMPKYSWFYNGDGTPNAKGIAIITYVTWLGSWALPGVPAPSTSQVAGAAQPQGGPPK
jgi:hypothetical protein